jgi:hypothetical protein
MRFTAWLAFILVTSYSSGATVCEVLDRRLELNGKDIEVVGHLEGWTYSGLFVSEKPLGSPCEYRWIFSWPSMLWLNYEGQAREVIEAKLKKSGGKPVDIDVKGRLFTRYDYYVINLPWRPGRPFGRYSYGGVAGTIAVSDVQVKESSPRR